MSSLRGRHKHRRCRGESDPKNSSKLKSGSHEHCSKIRLRSEMSVRGGKNTQSGIESSGVVNRNSTVIEYDLMTGTTILSVPSPNVRSLPSSRSASKELISQQSVNPSSKHHRKKIKSISHRVNNSRNVFTSKQCFQDSMKKNLKKKQTRTDFTDKTEITKVEDTKRLRKENTEKHELSNSLSDRAKIKQKRHGKDSGQKLDDVNPAMFGVAAAVNADNEEKKFVPVMESIHVSTLYNHSDYKKQNTKKRKKQKELDDLENAPTVFESVDAPIRPTTDEMPIRKIETTKEFPKEGTGKATVCIDETPTAYGQVDKKNDNDGRSTYLPIFPSYK